MTPDLLAAAQAHAVECYPRESAGVVVELLGRAEYFKCRNLSPDCDFFDLDASDLFRAEDAGRLLGYVHSHPGGPVVPSQRDLASCEISGLPWWIVEAPGPDWIRIDPVRRPHEGRQFLMGVDDCWSLAREWYKLVRGLNLPDFIRTDKFWERGETPHLDHLAAAGFVTVPFQDMRPGDGILLTIRARTVNHCGVYAGAGKFLHHLPGRLSRIDELGPWLTHIAQIVRNP